MDWYFAAGDGPFFFAETIRNLGWLPVLWRADEGFGANHGFRLWYDYALQLVIKILSSVGLTWWWIDKFLWVGVITLALFASYSFGKHYFKKPYVYLVPLIYTVNSYFLLLFSGGQLGVAWAYAYFPFVFSAFTHTVQTRLETSIAHSVKRGLYLALLTMFDLRFAYLLIGVVALYHLYFIIRRGMKKFWVSSIDIGVSLLVTIGIHAFWIVPTLFVGGAGVGGLESTITNPGMLRFLSFADFSHALSLLHPNWPENLFGKTYFLQPEFLIIPILAFSSFLFSKTKNDTYRAMLFFGLLAIVGAFVAKGVQEPFGGIYTWVFTYVPGFVMFRDPTKFYVFVALAYSLLIPFLLTRIKNTAVFIVFVVLWLGTVRALFVGDVKGNFRMIRIPDEYVRLKNVLVADSAPSRTLWIPQREKFAYASDTHPLLFADELFPGASLSALTTIIENPQFINTLKTSGVGYVVVPQDVEGRLFLSDYRFDKRTRDALTAALKKSSLTEVASFHDISVFKNNEFFFTSETPETLSRQFELTNTGLVISLLTLAGSISAIVLGRKK